MNTEISEDAAKEMEIEKEWEEKINREIEEKKKEETRGKHKNNVNNKCEEIQHKRMKKEEIELKIVNTKSNEESKLSEEVRKNLKRKNENGEGNIEKKIMRTDTGESTNNLRLDEGKIHTSKLTEDTKNQCSDVAIADSVNEENSIDNTVSSEGNETAVNLQTKDILDNT